MDINLIKEFGKIAGLGGIAFAVFFLLFKEILRKNIFPTLTKDKAYSLLILITILIWSLAVIGIGSWVYSKHLDKDAQFKEIEEQKNKKTVHGNNNDRTITQVRHE